MNKLKRIKMKHYIYTILLAVLVLMSSCEDYITIEPKSEWKLDNYFENPTQVDIAFGGMYGMMRSPDLFGEALSISMAYGTDEGYYNRAYDERWTVSLNAHTTLDPFVADTWRNLYTIVHNANNMITYMDPANFEEEEYNRYLAEARFLRGFAYLNLTLWWNEVPLREMPTTDQTSNHVGLSTLGDVYNFIIEDLEFASHNLPHVTDGSYIAGRAHRMAAHGLLARLYMKMGGYPYNNVESYQKALAHCDTIIYQDVYHQLRVNGDTTGYRDLFIDVIGGEQYDLKENLFEITFTNNLDIGMATMGSIGVGNGLLFTAQDGQNYPTTKKNFINASPILDMKYDETDKRKNWNIPGITINNALKIVKITGGPLSWGYCPGKFRRWDPENYDELVDGANVMNYVLLTNESMISINQSPINFPVLRYSDVLLMYAEAANEVSGGPTAEALQCINEVRDRAGLEALEVANPSAAGNKDLFFEEIVDERLRELAFEGLRKHDLVRWGLLDEKLAEVEAAVKGDAIYDALKHDHFLRAVRNFDINKHLALPYPFQEVTINDKLDQKPEWSSN
ncbi:RagB/SusD family nutrient uptake outer membrane protein [Labilibacter sediminis]|nr:RagB/SusD family nutrient uptake outer membrane protein [Labilibacter sediminis]